MKFLQHDNIAAHYRTAIYKIMDKELGCDFCFGDRWEDIKKMDYTNLSNKVIEVHNIIFPKGIYYQKGILRLTKADYDAYIIIGETKCISTWLFCLKMRMFHPDKKVYFWSHGWYGKENAIAKIVKKLFFKLPNSGIFLYGNHARELMIKEGFDPNKLYVIHNSLDYDVQLSLRNSLNVSNVYQEHFGNDNKNIVFIGRLTKVKQLELLLNAVKKLKEQGEFVNVTLIGDGEERVNLEKLAADNGIERQIWFYGACYDERKNAELIYNADLCVSPGNIGLTAIHVLMFGCPAVTNNDFNHQMPEFEAVKDGETGAFFAADDSDALAETISQWFSNHKNDREEIRKACYDEIDNQWTPYYQINLIKDVLNIK